MILHKASYSFLILLIINIGLAQTFTQRANAKSYLLVNQNHRTSINRAKNNYKLINSTNLASAQVCTCRSYYGIPHTCYYSSVSDSDYSCTSKCVREANQ